MGYYTGKNILIIGGTGTIGRGLIKQLLKQNPKVIRVFSRDEYKQFIMGQEFNDDEIFRYLIGDVRDYERVERAMYDIDVVFNLAAMKHVPSCEYNPTEAIKTNVHGMENVIKAAIYNNVDSVAFTSSDKAINPTNTYGATKLLAEKLVQAANFSKGNAKTRFVAVRFGNVMGSRGSVIPLFRDQVKEGKSVTVTDSNMTRFMMTLSQAVKLIMTSAEIAYGGEAFVLKMPIIKLKDLVEVVVEETCKKLNMRFEDVDIKRIGLRPGERKFEELMTKQESEFAYDIGDMYAVMPSTHGKEMEKHYCNEKKAEVVAYNSSNMEIIHKQQVRRMLLEEGLV